MKKVAAITLFPEMFSALSESGITGRSIKQKLISWQMFNPRDFTEDKHQTVDHRPYGGGPGMVMKVEPLLGAIGRAKTSMGEGENATKVVYMSPQGRQFTSRIAEENALDPGNLILIAGRYEGVDERFLAAHVDEEWSIGDYVLSGGELACMVVLDAIIRKVPGALGHEESATQDSFENGLLDCPHYTRPEVHEGISVPQVLLSGNHEKIKQWRFRQSVIRTWQRRPELIEQYLQENKARGDHETCARVESIVAEHKAE